MGGKFIAIANHRLAWFIHYGVWPIEVDHLDGDGLNNKLSNLKDGDRTANSKNHRRASNNTSGLGGVSFRKKEQYWRVYGTLNRKQVNLGLYDNLLDACARRISWQKEQGYSDRHGS